MAPCKGNGMFLPNCYKQNASKLFKKIVSNCSCCDSSPSEARHWPSFSRLRACLLYKPVHPCWIGDR